MMEPLGCGLEGEVWSMPRAACLVARKTLGGGGVLVRGWFAGRYGRGSDGIYLRALVRMTCMNSSTWISVKCLWAPTMPALANMMSRRPYLASASSTTAFTAGSSAASNWRVWMSTEG